MNETPNLTQLPPQEYTKWENYVEVAVKQILLSRGIDLEKLRNISQVPWHQIITPISVATHNIAVVKVSMERPEKDLVLFCKLTATQTEALVEAKGYQILSSVIPEDTISCLYPLYPAAAAPTDDYDVVVTEFERNLEPLAAVPDLFTDNIGLFNSSLEILVKLHSEKIIHGDLWLRNIAHKDGKIFLFDAYSVIDLGKEAEDLEANKYMTYLEQVESLTQDYLPFNDEDPQISCIAYEFYMILNSKELQAYLRSSVSSEDLEQIRLNVFDSISDIYLPKLQVQELDKKVLADAIKGMVTDFIQH